MSWKAGYFAELPKKPTEQLNRMTCDSQKERKEKIHVYYVSGDYSKAFQCSSINMGKKLNMIQRQETGKKIGRKAKKALPHFVLES